MKPRHLLFFAAALAAGPSNAQITNNLQAYWDFEGNGNNNATALGGSAFNGTLIGNATTAGAAVKVGTGSLNLDGNGDYLDVNTSVDVNQPWSVSSWFRPDISPAGAVRMMVYESVGSYAMSYGLREGSPTTTTSFQLFNQRTGGDLSSNFQVPDSETANTWHHIVTSFTPSTAIATGSIRGYVNGVLRYNISVPANSTHGTATGFHIGTFRSASDRWFDGTIDEVAIWNSTLGAGDAYWIYNLGDRGFSLSNPERIKADNLTTLDTGGSWTGGLVPGATETLTFSSAFTQAGAINTGSDLSVAGMRVTGGSGLIQISNTSGYLETGALGIHMPAARDLTIDNLRVGSTQRWNIDSGSTFTVGSISNLTGSHEIDKWGAGTAILLCNSALTGTTTITGGTLQLGNDTTTGSLGSGAVVNNGVLLFNRSNETTVGNTISGTGNLFQDGSGTLVLTGSNTFSGLTDVLEGSSLRLENPLALQNSTLSSGGVIFDDSVVTNAFTLGGLSGSGDIILENDNSNPIQLTVGNNNGTSTFSGEISGPGSLVKTGTGTLTLAGPNTYAGGTLISSRRLHVSDEDALGSGAVTAGLDAAYAAAYASGGTPFLAMTSTGEASLTNGLVLPDPPATAYYALQKFASSSTTGTNLTLSGAISGGGPNMILQLDSPVSGDSTTSFTLSGENTFSGQVRLNRGAVILTNASALGNASLLVQTNSNTTDGNLRFTGSFTLPNNITIATNNNTVNTGSHNVTLSGVLAGGASWNKIGSGTLAVTNGNTSTGPVTINAGTLAVTTGGSLFNTGVFFGTAGTSYVIVNPNGIFETRDWNYGPGNALNTLRSNSYSVRIDGGTVRFTETFAALRGFRVGPNGGTLEVASGQTYTKLAGSEASQNIIEGTSSGGSLTLTGAGDGVIEDGLGSYGTWSPAAGITKTGAGTWSLAGTNSLSGNFAVEQGTLRLDATGSLTFALDGTTSNSLTGSGSAELDGQFFFNLVAADATVGNSWPVASIANKSFGASFQVSSTLGSFTKSGTNHTLVDGGNTWTFSETTGTLSIATSTGDSFASWINGFFPGETNPAIVGPKADPNNDGVANAVVYLLGGDPKDGNNLPLLPVSELVTNPGAPIPDGDYFRFTYRRNQQAAAAGLTTTVEHDTDLAAPWTTAVNGVDGVAVVETPDEFEPGIDKVEVFIPRGASLQRFSRLSVFVP